MEENSPQVSAPMTSPASPAPASPSAPVTHVAGKSKLPLWIGLAALVAAGAFGAYWYMNKQKAGGPSGSTGGTTGKTTLNYAVHWSDFQVDGIMENGQLKDKGLRQYLDEYETLHPDIKIKTTFIDYNEYPTTLQLLHDSDAVPDIFQIYSTWGVSFARGNVLDAPPADVQADVQKNYVSTAGVTIDGKIWGIPTEVNDYLLLYNKEMFKAAGIVDANGVAKAPASWDELVADAVKLAKRDSSGKLTQYGFSFLPGVDDFVTDPFLSVLLTNNGSFLSKDLKSCAVNQPEGVQASDAVAQLFKKGATDINGNIWDFGKGTVAMVIMAPWSENDLKTSLGAKFNPDVVGLAPVPPMKKRATLQYSWFLGVMNKSKNKQQAWDFLRWFTQDPLPSGSTRYGELLAHNIGAIPSRKNDITGNKSVLQDNFFRKPFIDELPFSVPEPNVLDSSVLKGILTKGITPAWVGETTSQKALDDICKQINEILAR